MKLANAIEAWGQAHRAALDEDELRSLAAIWRHVCRTPHAAIELSALTKDDARALMQTFEPDHQERASQVLNRVRTWALVPQVDAVPTVAPTDAGRAVTGHADRHPDRHTRSAARGPAARTGRQSTFTTASGSAARRMAPGRGSAFGRAVQDGGINTRPDLVIDAREPIDSTTSTPTTRPSTDDATRLVPAGDAGTPTHNAGEAVVRVTGPRPTQGPRTHTDGSAAYQGPVAGWSPPAALPGQSSLSRRTKGLIGALVAVIGLALLLWVLLRDSPASAPTVAAPSCVQALFDNVRPSSRLVCRPGHT